MELQVTFDFSDRLFALLEDKLPNLGRRIERSITKELGAQARKELEVKLAINPSPSRPKAESTEVQSSAEVSSGDTSNGAAPAEKAAPAPIVPEDTIPTLEDCRAALNRARIRFEGEDYDNLESIGRKKYHAALTKIVKTTVMTVSEGKSAKIPDLPEDRRAAFIAEMDALVLDENGNISTPPAPF